MKKGVFIRYFDYDRRLIPNEYVASQDEGVRDETEAQQRTGLSPGYPGWNLLYYCAFCSLSREEYNVLIETGANWGYSTILLAQALRDSRLNGKVYSVELREENYRLAQHNINKAGVADLVSLHCHEAKQFLATLIQAVPGTLRFAFLDSSHKEKDVIEEFDILYPRLDDESIVFFDNTYRISEDEDNDDLVNGALYRITERYGGNLVNFPNCSWYTPGQAVWQKGAFAKDWHGLHQRG